MWISENTIFIFWSHRESTGKWQLGKFLWKLRNKYLFEILLILKLIYLTSFLKVRNKNKKVKYVFWGTFHECILLFIWRFFFFPVEFDYSDASLETPLILHSAYDIGGKMLAHGSMFMLLGAGWRNWW